MAAKLNERPQPLARADAKFWREAFVAYELPAALRHGTKITPPGLAHLAGDFADSAVREYRMRLK